MAVSLNRIIKQLTSLVVLPSAILSLTGCEELVLFNSKGQVGEQIGSTMVYTVLIMLIVVIPTIFLSVYIPYKYRSGNKNAEYNPEWSHSTTIEIIVWGIPLLIIGVLGVEAYKTSFSLDPAAPIVVDNNPQEQPLKIQVVALDWKWLFIYPEEGIATINEISIPVDRPVQFLLSSDAAINSFFIPQLGGQLYAMAGMEGKLNLIANEAGVYQGISSNYSGYGFAGMRFNVLAKDSADYQDWIKNVQASNKTLDDETYNKLKVKSRDNKVEYFVNPNPLRFKDIIEENIGLNDARRQATGHGAHGVEASHNQEGGHENHEHSEDKEHQSH